MSVNRATVVYNNWTKYTTNILINEKYERIALKQIRVRTPNYRGVLMVDCGVKVNTKTYYESMLGPHYSHTIIRTINCNGSEIVKDFSKQMEFHSIQDDIGYRGIDIHLLDVNGRRVVAEGEYVLELF